MDRNKNFEQIVPEMTETPAKGRLSYLKEGLLRRARILLFAGLALVTPLAAGGKTIEMGDLKTKKKVEQPVDMKNDVPLVEEKTESESWRPEIPGVHLTFLEKDEKGQIRFNPWSILAPVQVELGRVIEKEDQAFFVIPYEYSRLFAAGREAKEPLRPEDHDKVVSWIDNELKKQMADVLYGLDMSKRVYGVYHDEENIRNLKIKDIRVTGLASPEGPREKGPSTLMPGAIDKENIELAETRASAAIDFTKESLSKLGFSSEVIEKAKAMAEQIQAKEVQFTDDELRELAAVAQGENGADDLEKIFNLIVNYNNNLVRDKETLAVLDRIVATKRGVEVTVSYEGSRTEKLLVPIPLLLVIPPLIREISRRRRKDFGGGERKLPQRKLPPQGTTPPTERIPRDQALEDIIRKTPLPEEGMYEQMEEKTIIDDLYVFFDEPSTIKRGLDYRKIADSVLAAYDGFSDKTDREIFASAQILNSWKRHDVNARREAGWREEDLSAGLDYENQPRQIQWARVHGRAIVELVEAKKQQPAEDYLTLLERQVKRLIQRRTFRKSTG